jgi:hypothetical protein
MSTDRGDDDFVLGTQQHKPYKEYICFSCEATGIRWRKRLFVGQNCVLLLDRMFHGTEVQNVIWRPNVTIELSLHNTAVNFNAIGRCASLPGAEVSHALLAHVCGDGTPDTAESLPGRHGQASVE